MLDHDLMASIYEKAISILAGNLNLGCSYLITSNCSRKFAQFFHLSVKKVKGGIQAKCAS